MICVDDGEQKIRRLIDVFFNVAGIFCAVPKGSRQHKTVGKIVIGKVHRHLCDDDDLKCRIDLFNFTDQVFTHESAGNLEIHDDNIKSVLVGRQSIKSKPSIGDHFADIDRFGKWAYSIAHSAHIELFIFYQ